MPVPDVCERAGEGCVDAMWSNKCVTYRLRPPRTELGNSRPGSSPTSHRPAPCAGCLVVVPKSKTMHNERKRAPPHRAASWFSFFSRGTRIPKNAPRDTGHIISQILSRLHRRAKTRDAIACSLITVSLSRLTLLNFPSHTVPYTHGHDRVSKVNDSGRACRRRRCSLLCFPHAHRFVIGSSIGSLLCFPLAKAE